MSLQTFWNKGAHPPSLGGDGLAASQPGSATRRLEDALPGTGYICESLVAKRLTGRYGKFCGVATLVCSTKQVSSKISH